MTASDHGNEAGEGTSRPWWVWGGMIAIVAIGCLLRGQALDVGLVSDDYIHQGMFDGMYPGEGYVPFDLYGLFRADADELRRHAAVGTAPWWSLMPWDPDHAGRDVLRFHALRPLSSALISLDRWLVPRGQPGAVWWWHAHSMLWFGATGLSAGLVLVRLFRPAMALLALTVFMCDAGSVVALGWLANRCMLVCGTFSFLALWAHVQRREAPAGGRRRAWLAAELLATAAALGGGEYGLAAVAYVVAYDGLGHGGERPWRARLRPAVPVITLGLLYVVAHRSLGYGIHGQVYTDPLGAPLDWMVDAAHRLPQMIASAIWAVPAARGVFRQHVAEPLWAGLEGDTVAAVHVGVSVCLTLAALGVVRVARGGVSSREWRSLCALVVGAVLGLVPLTVAPAHVRLVALAQLGAAALVAAAVLAAVRRAGAWWTALLATVLVVINVGGDLHVGGLHLAGMRVVEQSDVVPFARGGLLRDDPAELRRLSERDVVVINARSLGVGLHGPLILAAHGWPAPRTWRVLALTGFAVTARRAADDTLELTATRGAWLRGHMEAHFRPADRPLVAGDVRERPGLRIEVLADDGGDPTRLQFRFDGSLDDPRWLFVVSTAGGLERWTPPPVGEVAMVPVPALPELGADAPVDLPVPPSSGGQ